MRLEFHPAVQRDLGDALDYYRKEGGPNLSERFEKEFRACLSAIKAAPADFLFTWEVMRSAGFVCRISLTY